MNLLTRAGSSGPLNVFTRIPALWWQGACVLLVALLLRTVLLEIKPPHFDEGINGWFLDQMWRQGFYRYDPTNYHGPLYFYLLMLAELLMGRGLLTLRLVAVLFSTGIVAVVLLHGRWFGRAAIWAGLVLAISPAMVFYGRYAIHESLFVFCQVLFLYGYIRWHMEGGRTAVVCMVIGVAGSIATKETFFIFLGTWFIAVALVHVLNRFLPGRKVTAPLPREPVPRGFVLSCVAIAVLAVLLVFSGFLANPAGVRDMVMAFAPWLATGTGEGSGHEKPFLYWLQLLARYEWPLLATLIALPALLVHESRWAWRLGATGFGLVLAYSLIPYKTPWLIIGMLMPLSFAFGFLMELALARLRAPWRLAPVALGCVLLAASLYSSLRLNFRDYADFSEPYVYVQTAPDVNRLMDNMHSLIEVFPARRNMSVLVMTPDPWPLPWLLGRFPGLSYGTAESANNITADVIISDAKGQTQIEAALREFYYRQPLKIRDAADTGWAYYKLDTFIAMDTGDTELIAPQATP